MQGDLGIGVIHVDKQAKILSINKTARNFLSA